VGPSPWTLDRDTALATGPIGMTSIASSKLSSSSTFKLNGRDCLDTNVDEADGEEGGGDAEREKNSRLTARVQTGPVARRRSRSSVECIA